MSETYSFSQQLMIGENYEKEINDYFCENYFISSVSSFSQTNGLDYLLTNKKTEITYSVEYKGDKNTFHTGNIFIETWSVWIEQNHIKNKRGWPFTSCAQFLFYYVPQLKIIHCAKMTKVKENLLKWISQYGHTKQPIAQKNEEYTTIGILLPLYEFEKISKKIKIK